MVDEIDKAPVRNDHGRLWDVLLTMLEPETSKRFLDPSLQVECDLSHVSFVGTANSLDPLPAPLRDRMRAISVPEPTAEDLDALHEHNLVSGVVDAATATAHGIAATTFGAEPGARERRLAVCITLRASS